MSDSTKSFGQTLRRMRRIMVVGFLWASVTRLLYMFLLITVCYGVLDYWLAFDQVFMLAAGAILLTGALIFPGMAAWKDSRIGLPDIADRLDRLNQDRRKAILAAYELQRAPGTLAFFVSQAVDKGQAGLGTIPRRRLFPWQALRRHGMRLIGVMLIVLVLYALHQAAFLVIFQRVFKPWTDTPPYSPITFEIIPAELRVVYGEDLELKVRLEHKDASRIVWLMTRGEDGQTQQTACFEEDATTFSQRLERVTRPIDICFRSGKARTVWRPVTLVLTPRVSIARLKLVYPRYTNLADREFILGRDQVRGLRGTQAVLTLTSNRPLGGGNLSLTPEGTGAPVKIPGTLQSENTIAFDWKIEHNAGIEVDIQDVQGFVCKEPLKIRQHLDNDTAPVVTISNPDTYVMATNDSRVAIAGAVEDDLGLRKISLVRALDGYRDRAVVLGPSRYTRETSFQHVLDFPRLGVSPGQMIELYAEAWDYNPHAIGVGTSDIIKIKIISLEEFRSILRSKTSLQQFQARFAAVNEKLRELRDAKQALLDDIRKGKLSPEELARRLQRLLKQQKETQQFIDRIKDDVAVFDMEEAFAEELKRMAAQLGREHRRLQKFKPGDPGLASELAEQLKSDIKNAEFARQQLVKAQDAAQVSRVMQMASEYKQLVARQEAVVKKLRRFGNAFALTAEDKKLLESIRREEEALKKAIASFPKRLRERAAAVSEEYQEFKDTARAFADTLESKHIEVDMAKACNFMANSQGRDAGREAEIALAKMKEMLSKCEGFGQGAPCLKFGVSADMCPTADQLSQSMGMGGAGMGGMGQSMQGGEGSSDGYSMGGYSPLNIPLIGPARTFFKNGEIAGRGGGQGRGGRGVRVMSVDGTEQMDINKRTADKAEMISVDEFPLKYKEALIRYFNVEETE